MGGLLDVEALTGGPSPKLCPGRPKSPRRVQYLPWLEFSPYLRPSRILIAMFAPLSPFLVPT